MKNFEYWEGKSYYRRAVQYIRSQTALFIHHRGPLVGAWMDHGQMRERNYAENGL
jgi:hypothetical protein